MENISFECRAATDQERELTAQQLREHTERAVGMRVTHRPFGLMAYHDQKLIGSVVGKIFFNWLHIDLFWVDASYRGKGIGTQLMK